jgi:mannose-6-phosphate isomerase-like protein (cupin superfamily)
MAPGGVVTPGSGETLARSPERELVIDVEREEIVLTWSRYAAGEEGPGPHVHRRHADCFRVLAGELAFGLADRSVRLGAGGFVAVPPGLVHSFRNEGPAEARFLNFHAPGMGFAEHLRAMRDGRDEDAERFDQFDPPPDGGRPASDAVIRAPGAGGDVVVDTGAGRLIVSEGGRAPEAALVACALPDGGVLVIGAESAESALGSPPAWT